MVFIPFDATEEEVVARSVIREGIPKEMKVSLTAWLRRRLERQSTVRVSTKDYADLDLVHEVQTALWLDLGAPSSGLMELSRLVNAIDARGEQVKIRVVDFLLSRMNKQSEQVRVLSKMFNRSMSKYRINSAGENPRIAVRTVEGVEQIAQSAVDSAGAAGPLLSKAWHYAFGVDPQPAEAMDFAVKAVERVVTPVVCPDHPKPSLGIAARVVKDQRNWQHGLRVDGDKAPANETIYNMLQTLWAGQHYRHVDKNAVPPTVEQAQTHVQLAAAVVGWFSSGVISRSA